MTSQGGHEHEVHGYDAPAPRAATMSGPESAR